MLSLGILTDLPLATAALRRGLASANAVWGNEASVLVGDFLYSRAFQMMVEVENMRVMDIMAETTNTIAEGEVLQLLNVNDPDPDEGRYMQVIRYKTAKLFEAGTRHVASVRVQIQIATISIAGPAFEARSVWIGGEEHSAVLEAIPRHVFMRVGDGNLVAHAPSVAAQPGRPTKDRASSARSRTPAPH